MADRSKRERKLPAKFRDAVLIPLEGEIFYLHAQTSFLWSLVKFLVLYSVGPFEWTSLYQLSTEAYTLTRAVHGGLHAYPGLSTEAYTLTRAVHRSVHGSLQAYPGCPRKLTSLPRLSTEAYTLTYPGCPRRLTRLPRLSTDVHGSLYQLLHSAWYSQCTFIFCHE